MKLMLAILMMVHSILRQIHFTTQSFPLGIFLIKVIYSRSIESQPQCGNKVMLGQCGW